MKISDELSSGSYVWIYSGLNRIWWQNSNIHPKKIGFFKCMSCSFLLAVLKMGIPFNYRVRIPPFDVPHVGPKGLNWLNSSDTTGRVLVHFWLQDGGRPWVHGSWNLLCVECVTTHLLNGCLIRKCSAVALNKKIQPATFASISFEWWQHPSKQRNGFFFFCDACCKDHISNKPTQNLSAHRHRHVAFWHACQEMEGDLEEEEEGVARISMIAPCSMVMRPYLPVK